MSLPLLTTSEDIDSIVGYLKNKPTGATLSEAKAVISETMDRRKVAALAFWGIILKEDDRIKLAPLGWELARKTKSREQVLKEILDRVVPYRSVLEWIHHQGLESVTNSDVASQWHEHFPDSLGSDKENTMKDQAVCFFRIVEAAGMGKLLVGRHGALTRLNVDRAKLAEYIDSGPAAPPLSESLPETPSSDDVAGEVAPEKAALPELPGVGPGETPQKLRVFITHGKNLELVEQVGAILQLAEIECEVAIKDETTAIPVSEKVFGAMRRCNAGVIIVSKEQTVGGDGPAQINPNVLIEIGAAFVLYDRRVILVWEQGMPVPSNLQGLYRCEFEGKEHGWTSGMKLMKALKDFRK